MVCLILGRVAEFGFAAASNFAAAAFQFFYRVFTGSPAVGREIVVKAFGIRRGPFNRRKIIFDYFERGSNKRRAFACDSARLVRAFFTLDMRVSLYFHLHLHLRLFCLFCLFLVVCVRSDSLSGHRLFTGPYFVRSRYGRVLISCCQSRI